MNTTKERIPTATEQIGTNLVRQLLESFKVLDTIDDFIKRDVPEYTWVNLQRSIQWSELTSATLREIALKVYNHPHGCILLHPILQRDAIYFEDFGHMSVDWTNYDYWLTWRVLHKVHEVAKHCNKVHDGRIIAGAIANAGRRGKESWCAIRYAHY